MMSESLSNLSYDLYAVNTASLSSIAFNCIALSRARQASDMNGRSQVTSQIGLVLLIFIEYYHSKYPSMSACGESVSVRVALRDSSVTGNAWRGVE